MNIKKFLKKYPNCPICGANFALADKREYITDLIGKLSFSYEFLSKVCEYFSNSKERYFCPQCIYCQIYISPELDKYCNLFSKYEINNIFIYFGEPKSVNYYTAHFRKNTISIFDHSVFLDKKQNIISNTNYVAAKELGIFPFNDTFSNFNQAIEFSKKTIKKIKLLA